MIRVIFLVFFYLGLIGFSKSQVSLELGLGSQSTLMNSSKRPNMNYLSISPALRFNIVEIVSLRFGYRKGIGNSTEFPCYFYTPQYSLRKINMAFSSNEIILGVSYTTGFNSSRTRPYIMLEANIQRYKMVFERTGEEVRLDPNMEIGGNRNIDGITLDVSQTLARLGAGFQFTLSNRMLFFNEATIGVSTDAPLFKVLFSVDLGFRYYLKQGGFIK